MENYTILKKTIRIGVTGMEEARRKMRIFLVCIVAAAVLVGMIYYFTDVYGNADVNEGTLVQYVSEEV